MGTSSRLATGGLDDLLDAQQPHIEERADDGMEEERLVRVHRILVPPEELQSIGDERGEPLSGTGSGDRQPELVGVARMIGEPLGDEADHLPGDVIPFGLGKGRDRYPTLGEGMPVVGVVVPGTPRRLLAVHENAGAGALPPVEVLHLRPGVRVEPSVEIIGGGEEKGVGIDAGRDALVVADAAQAFVHPSIGRAHPCQPLDAVFADQPSKARREAPLLPHGEVCDPMTGLGRSSGGMADPGEDQHELVRVERSTCEGGFGFDEEQDVDLGVLESRVILEELGGEDEGGLHVVILPSPRAAGAARGRGAWS